MSIHLAIDVQSRSGHRLELLWGSKNDPRDAVATVNGREVKIAGGPPSVGYIAPAVENHLNGGHVFLLFLRNRKRLGLP